MRETQRDIIRALGVKPQINAREEIESRIQFCKDYLRHTRAKGFVLGISGGQDSSLGGRLAQLACEQLRDEGHDAHFVAMRLPHGVQHDEADAQAALAFIAPDETVTVNIKGAVDGLVSELRDEDLSDFNRGNVKARMRMVAQYALAADRGLLVLGTDHAAEAVTGFFTKFGDGAFDLTPLGGLTKEQGRELMRELGSPARLYEKVPTADLLDGNPGRTDEDELGVRYTDIDTYLTGGDVDDAVAEIIEGYYARSAHKRHTPVNPYESWWRRAN
ncbi:ammonia-dependent NAD(+) synthetase [Gulosibacter bifidus]|uniref:NH(3)-dependent NAD(+) synthetase n=1 Tax=Gulosibacter bifidus TaxID=272239 RepID=A0ABW5RJF5_9MICO|nr:ammonia-dependent NAD(+) synthetase [Gulosibacter bifidus]